MSNFFLEPFNEKLLEEILRYSRIPNQYPSLQVLKLLQIFIKSPFLFSVFKFTNKIQFTVSCSFKSVTDFCGKICPPNYTLANMIGKEPGFCLTVKVKYNFLQFLLWISYAIVLKVPLTFTQPGTRIYSSKYGISHLE